jgi:hypothetical protein
MSEETVKEVAAESEEEPVKKSSASWLLILFVPFICFCLLASLMFTGIFSGSALVDKNTAVAINGATVAATPSLTMTKDGAVCTILLDKGDGQSETFTKVPSIYFGDFDVQTPCQSLHTGDVVNATAVGFKVTKLGIHRNLVNIQVVK